MFVYLYYDLMIGLVVSVHLQCVSILLLMDNVDVGLKYYTCWSDMLFQCCCTQVTVYFSCSNMFQHGVRIFLDDYLPLESVNTPEEEEQREYMEDFIYWIRTVWQHIISHYVRVRE